MASQALDRFLASTVAGGSRAALDRYDYDAWLELEVIERGEGLDAVVEKLRRRENDPRAVRFLLDFNVAGDVTDELVQVVDGYPPDETKAWLHLYLWEMDVQQGHIEGLAELAKSAPDPDIRALAVDLLSRTTNKARPDFIPEALLEVAGDEDEDVRFAAQQAAYRRYEGFEDAERIAPSAYSVIPRLLLSDLPTVNQEGLNLLAWAVRRAAKGAPVLLGSFAENDPAVVERFERSWKDRSQEIDAEAAVALTGMGRWWAIYALLGSIHDDARASRCLATMKAISALPSLREQAEEGFGEDGEAAREAAQTLSETALAEVLDTLTGEAEFQMSTDRLAEIAQQIVAVDPERLFDAAVTLAAHEDESRAAFRDAAREAASGWFAKHGAELNLALGLG